MSTGLEQTTDRPLATYSIRGQQVEYCPLTDDELQAVLSRATPKQRMALLYVSRGMAPSDVAERVPVSKDTLETWRGKDPAFKNAWYTVAANGQSIPAVNVPMAKIMTELDLNVQASLWRELGDIAFDSYWDVPLFWLAAEAVVNPEIVGDYAFPGSISGTWTHPEYITAAQ